MTARIMGEIIQFPIPGTGGLDEARVGVMLTTLEALGRIGIVPKSPAEAGRLLVLEGYSAADLRLFFKYYDLARALVKTGGADAKAG